MQSIEVSRVIDAPAGEVREAMADLEPFMRAAGFDEVTVDGDHLGLAKTVGLLRVSLDLELFEDEESPLAYRQADGIFEDMVTYYYLTERGDGVEVRAETEFALDAPGGSLLDATVIKRQRRKELTAQFDYLEETVGGG
jgi:hypothetical protein